jgi:hypothetical protein
MMKKIWGILIVGLLVCNISYGKTKEGLFGLKLGVPIDQSIIINEVKEIPDKYNYLNFYMGQDGIAYQVEPPEKNKIFTHYFVLVYPISKKIYEIYAYRDSWDKRYDGEKICEKKISMEALFGSGPVAPVEFGISLGVIEKDESEFLKLLKDKEEKKIKEEEELYDKILDKTGL